MPAYCVTRTVLQYQYFSEPTEQEAIARAKIKEIGWEDEYGTAGDYEIDPEYTAADDELPIAGPRK